MATLDYIAVEVGLHLLMQDWLLHEVALVIIKRTELLMMIVNNMCIEHTVHQRSDWVTCG